MNTRIVKVIIYFRQKTIFFGSAFLIFRNHSITQLTSFPIQVTKRPCSEINAFMNWNPGLHRVLYSVHTVLYNVYTYDSVSVRRMPRLHSHHGPGGGPRGRAQADPQSGLHGNQGKVPVYSMFRDKGI
jgi:hypothetical protein